MAVDARADLVSSAQSAFREWPALEHAHDDWPLGRVTKRIWKFGRVYAEQGEKVLFQPGSEPGTAAVYSRTVMVDVTVPETYVRALESRES